MRFTHWFYCSLVALLLVPVASQATGGPAPKPQVGQAVGALPTPGPLALSPALGELSPSVPHVPSPAASPSYAQTPRPVSAARTTRPAATRSARITGPGLALRALRRAAAPVGAGVARRQGSVPTGAYLALGFGLGTWVLLGLAAALLALEFVGAGILFGTLAFGAGIAAIVLGIRGIKQYSGTAELMSIFGLVLGGLYVLLSLLYLLLIIIVLVIMF